MTRTQTQVLIYDLATYFLHGGTFNPETMDHQKVSELLGRCRVFVEQNDDAVESLQVVEEKLRKAHGTLRECELEILGLRKRNELLSAKVEVMDLFAQVLHTKPAERCCPASPDVVFQIVKRLEGM